MAEAAVTLAVGDILAAATSAAAWEAGILRPGRSAPARALADAASAAGASVLRELLAAIPHSEAVRDASRTSTAGAAMAARIGIIAAAGTSPVGIPTTTDTMMITATMATTVAGYTEGPFRPAALTGGSGTKSARADVLERLFRT